MRETAGAVVRPLASLLVALAVSGLVLALSRRDASVIWPVFSALWTGSFGSLDGFLSALSRLAPLSLTTLGVVVALRANLFNIGAQGQLTVGALAAAMVAAATNAGPAPVSLALGLVFGALAGAAWAFPVAWLKTRRGAHEVIVAILLNYVAQNTTRYLATIPFKDRAGDAPQTARIAHTFPALVTGHELTTGIFVALAVWLIVCVFLERSVWGYRVRFVGANPDAARASGIDAARFQTGAMLVSGGLCGLGGAIIVLGAVPFARFPADFYGVGYGFDGLVAGLLCAGSSWWSPLFALLLCGLSSGADTMNFDTDTPRQLGQILQAILIVAGASRLAISWRAISSGRRRAGGKP